MKRVARSAILACCALVAAVSQSGAQSMEKASPKLSAELQAVKSSLDKYQDPIVAVRDGYHSTQACVGYSDGMMGVHFVNMGFVGPAVDPAKPPVLIYEPVGNKLKLVAAEWFVPLATGVKEAPVIFGETLDGPMDGHEPILPKDLVHYDKHVWLWKENPAGMFAMVNSAVKCDDYGYTFVDKAPAGAHVHKH